MTQARSPKFSNRPLWRLAWKRLQEHSFQYLLFVLGVALGVAMMVSIDLANGSALRAFNLSTDAITGQATHRIRAIAPQGVPESLYRHLRRDLGITKAAPILEGYALAPQLGNQTFHIVGLDLFAETPFRNYFETSPTPKKSGAPDQSSSQKNEAFTAFLTEPNAVVLDRALAKQAGIGLGDSITLELDGRTESIHVVGLLDPANPSSQKALSNLVFTDIASAQELLQRIGYLSHIDLMIQDKDQLDALEADLPTGIVLEEGEAQKNAVKQMTAAFDLNLQALSLLALVVGMFLIYNTVTFSIIQRRSLFGVLRCLGVTPAQLFQTIMGEAALLSLVGSILGVGLGILLGRAVVGLITQTINDFYFVVSVQQVTLSPLSLLKGFLIGIAAALLAALIPAWEAMQTAPNTSIQRSTLESKVLTLMPWLVGGWAIASLLGWCLLQFPQGGLVTAFAGLFTIVLAAALITPPLTVLLLKGLSPLTTRLFGILGRLAPQDIIRSLSRTSVAIAALMVAVSVIVGVSIMIGSFRGTVIEWLDQTLQADIFITPPSESAMRSGSLPADMITEIRQWPELSDIVTYKDIDATVTGLTMRSSSKVASGEPDKSSFHPIKRTIKLISADGDISHGRRPYAWKKSPQIDPWIDLKDGKGVILSEALLLKENVGQVPESITLSTPFGEKSFPVLAVFYDYSSDKGAVILDHAEYETLWKDSRIASVGAFVSPELTTEEVIARLEKHFAGRTDFLIQSNQNLRQISLDIFDRTFAITQALRLLAIIVAFIGVLSALLSLQLERTREIGILRANGMTARQIWGITLLETGLMGSIAGVLAMPLGYVLAWILIKVINVRSFGWTLQMQTSPAYFWQAAAVAIAAALLAGLYPAWKMGRMDIAQAIREE